jgi:hypothetical protein
MFTFLLLFLQEAERLEPTEDPTGYTYIDYSEKRSLPISVPDYHYSEKAGERYVVIWIINMYCTYFFFLKYNARRDYSLTHHLRQCIMSCSCLKQ